MTDILLKGAIFGVPEVVLRPFSNTLLYGHAECLLDSGKLQQNMSLGKVSALGTVDREQKSNAVSILGSKSKAILNELLSLCHAPWYSLNSFGLVFVNPTACLCCKIWQC